MFLKCDIVYQKFWDEHQMEHNFENFSKIRVLLTRLSFFPEVMFIRHGKFPEM